MIGDWTTGVVLGILFVATLIRSAFGFGEALVAVPLLVLVIPIQVAAPVAVLISITVAAVVVVQDWQKIHLASAWRLVAASALGIPLGLMLLTMPGERAVKAVLALVIMAFSSYSLLRGGRLRLENERLVWLFGFGAGVLGGAYGMNGPPLVIYGTLRRWPPEQFRATLQGYFLPASLMGMAGYWLAGLWSARVTRYYLLALPIVALAIYLGRVANRRMRSQSFVVYIHVGLIVVGAVLLLQSLA